MAIKLIAIDMDGTLLLPDHTISPAVKNAIAAAREKGVNVVLTTGRPYAGVHSYLKELHMEQPGDYCITYNGALVQKAGDGSTVAQTALSYDDYRYLEKLSREVGSHFHALDRNTLYTANRDISYYTVHESYVATIPLVFCEAEKMDPNTQFLKVMMIDEPAVLDRAIARIPAEVKEKYTVLKSAPYFLEILDKRVNKGTGVKSLVEALGIKPEEVMAIGDQENDYDPRLISAMSEIRNLVEPAIARWAAERATSSDLAEIESALNDMIANNQDREAFNEADIRYHEAVLQSVHNPVLQQLNVAISSLQRAVFERTWMGDAANMPKTLQEHKALFDAIRHQDGDAAEQAALTMIASSTRRLKEIT